MQKIIELSSGWLLAVDPDNTGREKGFACAIPEDAKSAPVPGIIQQVYTSYHGVAWYYLRLETLPVSAQNGERLLLKFGAVDYFSEIFVDGAKVYENEGAENPFEIDVTDTMKNGSLLAVRVINPKAGEEIDGFTLYSTPHRNKADGSYQPGCCYNSGGIVLPVILYAVPSVRVSDCFVRADSHTGKVDLEITVTNNLSVSVDTEIFTRIRFMDDHVVINNEKILINAHPGETIFHFETKVENYRLWDIDSPNLYYFTIGYASCKTPYGEWETSFGFREFKIVNGYFMLNGRRIFLKCSHTGNNMPESFALPAPSMPFLEFRDFQLAKASGFNCIRFISTMATPRQLDYCDRLGLMIYQETYASWCMADSPDNRKRFDASILSEIKRDRNHPCITIWGMLNETDISDSYFSATEILPKLRRLDDTRLCIFSSGRWDICHPSQRAKPNYSIGSASNPFSNKWEYVWGDDGKMDDSSPHTVGDFHTYPCYPYSAKEEDFLRHYGQGTKPCFISEFGIGSHLNVIENCLDYERYNTDPTAPDYLLMRSIRDRYLKAFEWYGLGKTYASPADHLRDSEKFNARSRREGFDIVRSNPQFVGFNLTGLLDHAICGEGPFTFFRRYKYENYDVFQDGWYDLRWCLFINHYNIYPGASVELEAVLSDIDVLRDGDHTVVFAVTDDKGAPIWKKEVTFHTPVLNDKGIRAYAYPVMKETVTIDAAPGKYSFRAFLKDGAYAASSEKDFYITARPNRANHRKIAVVGLNGKIETFLTEYGFEVTSDINAADTICVGMVDRETGKALIARAESGAKVIFLDEKALMTSQDNVGHYEEFMPLPDYSCFYETDWLYHKEVVMTTSKYNLTHGFYDWDFYDGTFPRRGFSTSQKANEFISVNLYVGGPGEFHSSVNLASYNVGKGSIILNTFCLLDNLGTCPAGDNLLVNLVK